MLAESCQGAGTFREGDGAGAHVRGDGASPLAVDFDGDGTLQQADGDDEAVDLVRVGDDALQPYQGAALDVDLGSDAETGPRLRGKAGTKDGANGFDLFEVNGDGDLAGTDDTDDAGRGEDGQAIAHVKLAEQITGEERELEFFGAVGPPPAGAIERKELLVAFAAQGGGGEASESGLDPQGVPRQLVRPRRCQTRDDF